MKLWLSICAALVFAAGCAFGLLLDSQRVCTRKAPPNTSPAEVASAAPAGESVVASMVDPYPDYPLYLVSPDDFYDELGLEGEQRRRLGDLFAQHSKDVGDVRSAMARVASKLREGILEVLTPEQEVRFNDIQKRYSENKSRYYVGSELVELQDALGLRPEQEAAVFKHLYDARVARQAVLGRKNCKDRSTREQLREIDKKLEDRLGRVLFPAQLADYLKLQERKSCVKRREDRGSEKKDDKDCAPAAAPSVDP